MSDFDIKKHEWEDTDIKFDQAEEGCNSVNLRLTSGWIYITKEDSIALAKHFGHYKEPTEG